MTRTLTLLLFCCFQQSIYAQTNSIDALALKIPQANTSTTGGIIDYVRQNFSSDSDRVRAIYVWVTDNIKYDVERLKAMDREPNMMPQATSSVLISRKAVCQGYADLFTELCNGVGVKAIVVSGYTKQKEVISPIGHAWAAVQLNGTWYLFDPTWGAGYVKDDQFVKHFNNSFYKVSPAELIKDHMPFDPMYQFANYTITNKEFIEGKRVTGAERPYFNYADTLKQFELFSNPEKLSSEERRLVANGIRIDLLAKRVNYLKQNLQSFASKDAFTEASDDFRRANGLFREYVGYRNNKFNSIEDNALRQMIDSITFYTKHARSLMNALVPKTDQQRNAIAGNNQNLERFLIQFTQEKSFVDKYLAADKNARMQMFGRRN